MSRRDGAIVAWHEVPGTAPTQKSRPVGYGVIRATRNTSGISCARSYPYPTGRFFRGTLSQALRARLRSVLSLRDALPDISQQPLTSSETSPPHDWTRCFDTGIKGQVKYRILFASRVRVCRKSGGGSA